MVLQALIGPVTGLLDKFIPDADEKARLAHEIATMSERHAQELAKGQIEINKAEAAHKSMFVAVWVSLLLFLLLHLLVWTPLRYLYLKWKAFLQFCWAC